MLPLPTPRCIAARADRARSARTTTVTIGLRVRPCVPPCPARRVAASILVGGRLEGTGALLSSRVLEATRRSHPVAAAAPAPHVPRLSTHLRKRAAGRRPKSAPTAACPFATSKTGCTRNYFSANARLGRRGSRTAARKAACADDRAAHSSECTLLGATRGHAVLRRCCGRQQRAKRQNKTLSTGIRTSVAWLTPSSAISRCV